MRHHPLTLTLTLTLTLIGLEVRHHLLGWRELLAGLLGRLERVILLLSEFRGLLL